MPPCKQQVPNHGSLKNMSTLVPKHTCVIQHNMCNKTAAKKQYVYTFQAMCGNLPSSMCTKLCGCVHLLLHCCRPMCLDLCLVVNTASFEGLCGLQNETTF